MSAAGPPQSANSAPSGGSAAAKPQAWGDHTSTHASTALDADAGSHAVAVVARAWRRLRPRHLLYAVGGGIVLGGWSNFTGMQPLLSDDWTTNFNVYGGWILHLVALLFAIPIADEVADRLRRVWVAYAIAIVGAGVAGTLALGLVDWLLGIRLLLRTLGGDSSGYLALLWRFSHLALLTGLITFVYVRQRAALRSAAALHDLQRRSAELARRTLESRLQAMQARVDPQFLFDTLARVEQLHDREPATADRVLGDLIVYLRAVLPLVKETASTLATEFDLLRAYLDIVRAGRAGRTGLSFDLSLPEALAAMRIPPMLLLPLVEPFVGRSGDVPARCLNVRIAAHHDDELAITIAARDMAPATGAIDAAVDRIRERLAALFGTSASLAVRQNAPGSLEARLAIPYAYAVGADR